MSTYAFVNTSAHTVTHVTNKLLLSFKEIIRETGLDVTKMSREWPTLERGVSAWIGSKHLENVILEIFDAKSGALVGRWDIEIAYGYIGDGSLWVDTDAIKYSIRKAGLAPRGCDYRFVVTRKPNARSVEGWSTCELRSTVGFSRYCIGTTIGGSGLGANVAYWGK